MHRIGDRPWFVTIPLANAAEGKGLSKLWARRKIADAEVAKTLRKATPEETDKRILALGLDHHPELRDAYFGNYTRVVLLSQTDDPAVLAAGRKGSEMLGLEIIAKAEGRHVFFRCGGGVLLLFDADATEIPPSPGARLPVPAEL